jgi:hypothetical protein
MGEVARALDAIELLRLAFDGQSKLAFWQKAITKISCRRDQRTRAVHDSKDGLPAFKLQQR